MNGSVAVEVPAVSGPAVAGMRERYAQGLLLVAPKDAPSLRTVLCEMGSASPQSAP